MIGKELGPYRVLEKIGEGGMGQVYRARDTKLNRDVALKILPDAFARDPERVARFQREAHVLASLNHPNIAQIYGLEDSGHTTALVMELVDGQTLAEIISHASSPKPHAIPISEALAIVRQIADALEAAHDRGIIHRDLKPANVKVRPDGTVKVLDFGLAKALVPDAASASPGNMANSPTITSPAMTEIGMILGTAAYMAPEQARGRGADKRADIWALGCVLFEMLAGTRAFPGDDVTDMLAAVVKLEPNWSALPNDVPARVRQVLRVCLQKDPRQRGGDIAAIRLALDGAFETPTSSASTSVAVASSRGRWIERVALGLVTIALAAVAALYFTARPEPRRTWRFQLTPPPGTVFPTSGAQPAASPDGRFVVFSAYRANHTSLWVQDLETMDTRELAGTENAYLPFWSPDNRTIAFTADRKLKRIDVSGGSLQSLADLNPNIAGGAWSPDGTTIIFTGNSGGLMRIPAAGGPATQITTVDATRKEVAHILPAFLPDGRRFLFRVIPIGIEVGSLDSPERKRLVDIDSTGRYAPPGYLVFVSQSRLVAQRFNASTAELSDAPLPLAADMSLDSFAFSVSPAGLLAYQDGSADVGGTPVWVDRTGKQVGTIEGAPTSANPRFSPDGQRLAVVRDGDIWVFDVRGRPPIRLTFDAPSEAAASPIWMSDGRRLIFERCGNASGCRLWSIPADGSERKPVPASGEGHFHPLDAPRDGLEILAVQFGPETATDVAAVKTAAPFETRVIVKTPASEGILGASLSPDGRWFAYTADPTGSSEIWVRPFDGSGAAVRVSPNGGEEPIWSRNGRELFYRERGRVMAVSAQAAGIEFQFTPPVALFDGQSEFVRGSGQAPWFDVAADGRFLLLKAPASRQSQPITVVVNWVEGLERRQGP